MKTIEYCACVDCYVFSEYEHGPDDITAFREDHLRASFKVIRNRDKLSGFCSGEDIADFAKSECEICGSIEWGSRHQVIGLQNA